MRRVAILPVLLLFPQALAAQEPGRAFTPADWYRMTTVRSPALSPDGQLVAFTVTTVNEAENARHSEVWVVPADGGEPLRYTSPATESSNPRWSLNACRRSNRLPGFRLRSSTVPASISRMTTTCLRNLRKSRPRPAAMR